jgi:hypothetical protein
MQDLVNVYMTLKLLVLQNLSGRDGAVLSFVHFACHFSKTRLWVLLPVLW